MLQPTDPCVAAESADSGWKTLYRIGAVAALVAVIIFRRNFSVELVQFKGFGIIHGVPATWPSSAIEWFSLLEDNVFVGLVLFNVVDLINYCLVGLMFLALYGALRRANKSAMVIATVCGLMGIAVYFASNQAFAMLSLSRQYAGATTEAHRSMLLAAGEALLAIENPGAVYQGTGVHTSFLLVVLAGLIISVVMLRSSIFGRAAAMVGIVANGLRLCHLLALVFAPSVWFFIPISAVFRVTWYVMIALGLFKLARRTSHQADTVREEKGKPDE
ncbi:MAG: DUF4386 family protein [Anaerolineae bacterium]|nr:DUF4386 family protein [Anaerolineae bacterium]